MEKPESDKIRQICTDCPYSSWREMGSNHILLCVKYKEVMVEEAARKCPIYPNTD
jgi:hypothetical protein